MKILAIGDIHGRKSWQEICIKHGYEVDQIIFLGDYFDNYGKTNGEDQVNNFLEIVKMQQISGNKIILLTGNHDFHYLFPEYGEASGYQHGAAPAIRSALKKASLEWCAIFDGVIYSHAGVTNTWLENNVDTDHAHQPLSEIINGFQPKSFRFTSDPDDYNPYGDNKCQTPIWVRPRSLMEDALAYKQVVGHTQQENINIIGSFAFIDCLERNQYLIVEDGKFKPMNL